MAYNDHTVAINPDGDGNSVFYSDNNPTINGQYIGGGYTFGADAARDGHITAQIVYGRHHVASLNGYYIMTETNRMFDTSDTFTTLNVIDGNGSISNHITTTGTILRGKDSGGTAINYITKTTTGGGLKFGADDSVIIGAGEMGAAIENNIASLADEAVHIGGESGVYFYSSPDNISSGWAGRHSMRFNESGRLGIRTESPTSTLHILGENDNQVKIDVAAGSSFSSLSFARAGANVAVVAYNHNINQFQLYSNCTCSYISMYTGGAERATLTKEGRFGIGKTEPSHPLHIYDAGNSVYARWERSTGNMYIGSDSIGGAIGTTGNIPLYFYTGDGTERMRLSCQGNLGIGQSNPLQKLAVAGNILLGDNDVSSFIHGGGNVAMSADASLLFVSDSNGTTGAVDGDIIFGGGSAINTDADRSFGYDSAYPSNNPRCEYMRIKGTGNIGIGINSPTKKLHVNGDFAIGTGTPINNIGLMEVTEDGSAKGIGFYAGSGTSFRVYRAGDIGILGRGDNINLSINCFGNVGINSCTPGSYKLYVNGAFYAAGSSCEYKTQICQYNTDSCMFMKLTPVTYQYKDQYCHLGKELKSGTQIGLIAEDVAEVYPELAILKDEEDEKVVRNVDYEKLSIILLSELQKLRAEVDELKSK